MNPEGHYDNARGLDGTAQFFIEAQRIADEARFVIDSLPNADLPAAERAIRQLKAVQQVLLQLNDPLTPLNDQEALSSYLDSLIRPLDAYIIQPPPDPRSQVPLNHTTHSGRPSYIIDLDRALELHRLGIPWREIAKMLGVHRSTLYNHMGASGIHSTRIETTVITDNELDTVIAEIARAHPFIGSTIMSGHLEAAGIHVARQSVLESLRRVDAAGMLIRWAGIIKRRVYRVRGANALWHIDGNEKLRPWGFYVHGCVDGHSRLIIYLLCSPDKRAATVLKTFVNAVSHFGWPSRGRGDFGTENNDVENALIAHWGEDHRAFLRGRSLHNVRIERLWRDVRKDCLEAFRQVFMHLEQNELLDMENPVHRVCLFLVYHKRVQTSLDRARDAWNHHKLRTEHNRTPIALYELSREQAIKRGYWTGDPGDDIGDINEDYGIGEAAESVFEDEEQTAAGVRVNGEGEIAEAARLLSDFDCDADDGNWGIDIYCQAVVIMLSRL